MVDATPVGVGPAAGWRLRLAHGGTRFLPARRFAATSEWEKVGWLPPLGEGERRRVLSALHHHLGQWAPAAPALPPEIAAAEGWKAGRAAAVAARYSGPAPAADDAEGHAG